MQNIQIKSSYRRRGILVLIGLGVLTAIEYVVAVAGLGGTALTLLVLVALAKGAIIVDYFMHAGKLFAPESGGH